MKQSLKRKTSVTITAMVLLAFIVGLCLCFAFSNKYYISVKQTSLVNVFRKTDKLYKGTAFGSTSELSDESYQVLSTMCEENTISMLVMSPAGVIDFSYGNSAMMVKRLDDISFGSTGVGNERIIESNDEYVLQSYTSGQDHKGYVEIWGVLNNGNLVIARSSYAGINNSVRVSLTFFCIVCAIVFVIVAVFIFALLKPYIDSLSRMLVFAQKANMGEFEAEYEEKKASHKSQDEIAMLGANISEMSHKLEKSISELKTTNLRLENELKAKIAQEEARKKYMSDVSHELKTPIALISSYAEGIKEGISDTPEDREYYCSVIIDEAEKMNLMVKKLATLNQLEQGTNEVSLERFNVVDVIDGFLNTMSISIEEKGLNVYFDNSRPVYVWSDEFLFEEVLVNYFNNAVNHVDAAKNIAISVDVPDAANVRVTVFNSGSHIEEAEIDKIWGKFYKVDKARTRAYGGSGLGLSIVKAVADSLGRECGVYNQDDGVAFWINLEPGDAGNGSQDNRQEDTGNDSQDSQPKDIRKTFGKLSSLPIWRKSKKAAEGKDADNAGS